MTTSNADATPVVDEVAIGYGDWCPIPIPRYHLTHAGPRR